MSSVCSVSSSAKVRDWLAYYSCSVLRSVKGSGPETDGMLEDFEIVSQIRSVEIILLAWHRWLLRSYSIGRSCLLVTRQPPKVCEPQPVSSPVIPDLLMDS
jgi:hypothetical protein